MTTKTDTETMTYDKKGLLIERAWAGDDGATSTETMEYDDRGLLVKRTVVNTAP